MGQAVEMTNKQKTISLKQARLMNQRPPDLMPASGSTKTEQTINEEEEEGGLQIDGLNLPSTPSDANSFENAKDSLPESPATERSAAITNGDLHHVLLPDPLAKMESK
jgi:hypothetical protein